MKIAVAGVGYVGLSLAVLFSQHNEVYAVSTTPAKVDMINSGKSPIVDKEIQRFLKEKKLNLTATTDKELAYRDAEFVVVATPTNYDPDKNYFDTSAVEDVIETVLKVNPEAIMVIKSTVPVGYTERVREQYRAITLSSLPSFSVRAAHCMIISILPASLLVLLLTMKNYRPRPMFLPSFCLRALRKRMFRFSSPTPPRLRL